MTKRQVAAGATVASLAAAGMVAIWRYRQGKKLRPEDISALDALHERLAEGSNHPVSDRARKLAHKLEMRGVGTVHSLLRRIVELKAGKLDEDASLQLENHFDHFNNEASREGL